METLRSRVGVCLSEAHRETRDDRVVSACPPIFISSPPTRPCVSLHSRTVRDLVPHPAVAILVFAGWAARPTSVAAIDGSGFSHSYRVCGISVPAASHVVYHINISFVYTDRAPKTEVEYHLLFVGQHIACFMCLAHSYLCFYCIFTFRPTGPVSSLSLSKMPLKQRSALERSGKRLHSRSRRS